MSSVTLPRANGGRFKHGDNDNWKMPSAPLAEVILKWAATYETQALYARERGGNSSSSSITWQQGWAITPTSVLASRTGFAPRWFYDLTHGRIKTVTFGRADAILCAMDMPHEWSGSLAPWYPSPPARQTAQWGKSRTHLWRMSPENVRRAHALHMKGLSFNDIARLVWKHYGFNSERSCAVSIWRYCKRLGLETRSQERAISLALTKDGLWARDPKAWARRNKRLRDPEYGRHCASSNRRGQPCGQWAMRGSENCYVHTKVNGRQGETPDARSSTTASESIAGSL